MKKEMKKRIAKGTVTVLKMVLSAEANSTSCGLVYQPKAPKELKEYKRTK